MQNIMNHPKFKEGDIVTADLKYSSITGEVAIVDKYGVFEDSSQPYYDILCKDPDYLCKHVPENCLRLKE